jgi:hydrogenase expression/formation protein HypC
MCLSFPGRVVDLDAAGAIVETDGRRRRASVLLVPDVAVGEWVAVAAGTIVDRLDDREAAELQALVRLATAPIDVPPHDADGSGGDRHGHAK